MLPGGPYFFTPINEITFFAFAGGEWGCAAPYGKDRATRERLRLALCGASIAGVKALRRVLPDSRMVHVDPLIQVVAPPDRPDRTRRWSPARRGSCRCATCCSASGTATGGRS